MDLRLGLSGERPPAAEHLPPGMDSVGLIRSEYLLRERELFLTDPAMQDYISSYVSDLSSNGSLGDIWYRTTEVTTPEANTLSGVDRVFYEADFMKGRRGIRRARELPETFLLEMRLLAEIARDRPNLHVLVPFVRDLDDFRFAVEMFESVSWPNRFGTMIEIPSAVDDVSAFVEAGASNLLVGLNDLTGLITGTTREAGDMKHHPSVWRAIERVAEAAEGCEWGVAGDLTEGVLERARVSGVPYASIHYHQLHELLGVSVDALPESLHVAETKVRTRSQIAAEQMRSASGASD